MSEQHLDQNNVLGLDGIKLNALAPCCQFTFFPGELQFISNEANVNALLADVVLLISI